MKLSIIQFLPTAKELFSNLQLACELVEIAYQEFPTNDEINADSIANQLANQLADWEPEIKGKMVLCENTKIAACKFLVGIAINLRR